MNKLVSNIFACHLFLQIHYVDNLLLEPLQPPKNIFPRMKAFPTEVLNKLILADTKPRGGYGANSMQGGLSLSKISHQFYGSKFLCLLDQVHQHYFIPYQQTLVPAFQLVQQHYHNSSERNTLLCAIQH